jgi:hypothetical protein
MGNSLFPLAIAPCPDTISESKVVVTNRFVKAGVISGGGGENRDGNHEGTQDVDY